MDDHRRYSRSQVATLVKIESQGEALLGTSLNVSLSGIACELTQNLPDSKPVMVSFRLSLKDRPITAWARPIWSAKADGKWRIGLVFENLDSSHHRTIADHLAKNWEEQHNLAAG